MRPSPLRHPARLAGASLLRLQSDERLAELAAGGHEAAFDAIVDRYRTPLTRYCAGIVGPSRAEDAVQQALINAHDALKRTDEVRHLRSWLYRIAHNASLNVLRAVRDDVSLDEASGAAAVAEHGPAATFERSERFRATVEALRELPENQRAALVLRELEGRSHEEIAEALGVTKGSARQHLMRARTALRGAVTAITPYPLVVRLAEMLASPGATGWTDAAVGAGAGATLAKLTAGIAATGALVGGAVGTERVVHHRHHAVEATTTGPSAGSAAKSPLVKDASLVLPAAGASGPSSTGTAGRDDRGRGNGDRSRGRGSDDGGRGSDDAGHRRSGHGEGGGGASGSSSGSSHGSGGSGDDDRSGHGGGSHHSGSSGRGSGGSGSGSSGKGSGGSESSGSGSGDWDSSGKGSGSSGSGRSVSGSSGSGDSRSGSSGSGSGGSGSSGGDSGSGGSGDSSDDAVATPAPATEPAPTTVTTTPTTSGGDDDTSGSSGSGSSGGSDTD